MLKYRLSILYTVLFLFLLFSVFFAVTIGSVQIPYKIVWKIVLSHIIKGFIEPDWNHSLEQIVWFIRFPRVLLAILVGSSLAIAGVVLQALVRNPLADPHILGVSSGASVGAVVVILMGFFEYFGIYSLSFAAFVGGLCAFLIVLLIASQNGRITPLRIVLSGIAVSYVCSSITSLVVIRAKNAEAIQTVLYWLLGSVAGAKWEYLTVPALILAGSIIFLILQARPLNAILIGEETAITLGVDINRFRKQLIAITALQTGAVVSVSGSIGFVGLMIPHIARIMIGSDHHQVLPLSALIGGIFLIWADLIARVIATPEELPIGVITSFIGGPFFIWLMRRRSNLGNSD